MPSFSAQVSGWVNEVKGASEAVLKQSAQELVNEAQTPRAAGGRMRVDTGFLRASLMASTAAMPTINPNAKPSPEARKQSRRTGAPVYTPVTGEDVTAALIGAKLGDTLYIGYTAAYAAAREYGAPGQTADVFVRTAAQKWPQIVARVEQQLMARLGR